MITALLTTVPLMALLGLHDVGLASRENRAISIPAPAALDTTVWSIARAAYVTARERGLAQREFLVVIDYSRPSTERRMWVVNMFSGALVTRTHVAHGSGSGAATPFRFSNRVNSNQSSLGVFITGESYIGQHGRALRLDGVEPGINDMARVRNVVFHGSRYVSDWLAERSGRIGRSQGCPAVAEDEARRLVPILEGGAVLFAWYPERTWLQRSRWIPDALRQAMLPTLPPKDFAKQGRRRGSRRTV